MVFTSLSLVSYHWPRITLESCCKRKFYILYITGGSGLCTTHCGCTDVVCAGDPVHVHRRIPHIQTQSPLHVCIIRLDTPHTGSRSNATRSAGYPFFWMYFFYFSDFNIHWYIVYLWFQAQELQNTLLSLSTMGWKFHQYINMDWKS